MFTKKLLVPLLVLLVLTLVSCSVDKYDLENEQKVDQQKVVEKTIHNHAIEKTDDKSISAKGTNSLQEPNIRTYSITQSSYIGKGITINYPQITGLNDTNKLKKINELIKKDALRILECYKSVGEVTLGVNYDIKRKDIKLLSIQYYGVENIRGAAYPKNVFYTTNIDINNATKIKLTDCVKIDETFVKQFREGKYVAWDTGLSSAIELIKGDIKNYDLVNEFKKADSTGEENKSNSFCYFTKDSLGISIGVAHAIGDHAEFEIKYQDLKGNIKAENHIWKE